MSRSEHHGHFFTEASSISETSVVLSGPDAHHLSVRRAKPGDTIHVGDGAGRLFDAVIESLEGSKVVASIAAARFVERPASRLTVYQGLAKSGKIDWVVEKLVELGVDEVVVFAAGRSVPLWDSAKGRAMLERWNRVARAASKQSRRAWLPTVAGPLDRESLLDRVSATGKVLIADPAAGTSLHAFLSDLGSAHEIGTVIGPEGGLCRSEVGQLVDAGATAVTFGSQVLRTETAGLAVAAVLMYRLGRFG